MDKTNKQKRDTNESKQRTMKGVPREQQDQEGCWCENSAAPHPGVVEGPNLPASNETTNRSKDEGLTYDV